MHTYVGGESIEYSGTYIRVSIHRLAGTDSHFSNATYRDENHHNHNQTISDMTVLSIAFLTKFKDVSILL